MASLAGLNGISLPSFGSSMDPEDARALRNYLYHLYLPALRNDIDLILANRYLPQENIQFLAEFYTCAFLYYFIRKCDQPGADRLTGQAGPFANIIHSSLEAQIKEAQLRRNL